MQKQFFFFLLGEPFIHSFIHPLIHCAVALLRYLSQEAPPAAAGVQPALEEQRPQLLPGERPAGQGSSALAVRAQGVRLLGVWGTTTHPTAMEDSMVQDGILFYY